MEIINAIQAKGGKLTKLNKLGSLTQPLQFLPKSEKDEGWYNNNLDWLEWQGMKQLRRNARRLTKNYKLAAGIIDKTDYIVEQENDYKDIVEQLSDISSVEAFELKFYPIIPNVIDTLVAEFAKRNKKISFVAVDDYSYNDLVAAKSEAIENVLLRQAEEKLKLKMLEQGADPNDPQVQEQMQQQMLPENLKSLPEIQSYFNKDYRSSAEVWASKQHVIDEERFKMDELEELGFRDSLITDREFWHFRMLEDDYDIELWNPVLTFYHKSPNTRYTSDGNWIGKIEMFTVADVIDRYGWVMTQEQMESLEMIYPVRAAAYPVAGTPNDGSFYDGTKSHAWNTNSPSLGYRQYTSMIDNFVFNGGDIVNWIMGQSEDYTDLGSSNLLRVTTAYWKSQMKIGYLTEIMESGEVFTDWVSEDFKITTKPLYNNVLIPNKTTETLIYGQHLEWIWVNQIQGGVKIGPHHPSFWGTTNPGGVNPLYLGINQNKMGPLKFQFKGDSNTYGCKLPVEGCVYSDRNTISHATVDRMKPFQIGYNIVNNQIADILIDEIGSVLLLDHNSLPQHSLGEDWGKHNYAKAYQVMKDFQIMPLDTTMANTENAVQFSHFQTVNLEQTSRLMSRIQLANYFKSQCFENIGVVPQRMGQQIGQSNTATGIEQAVTGSYAQTEMLFVQHSDKLMPRVHKMRTDLAQYYHSTKSSIRLQMMVNSEERANFELNGTDLLLRDINVFASAKASHRDILEKLQRMALENNTSGASIYDLGKLVQADSISTLNATLKEIDTKMQKQRQEEMQHEQMLKEKELEQRTTEKQMANDLEMTLDENKTRRDVLVAEIRASGYGAMVDLDENKQSDFLDAMEDIKKSDEFDSQMNFSREKEGNKTNQFREKMNIEKEKLQVQRDLKQTDLQIARENKNRFDKGGSASKSKK